jgi:hypothetical protein
MARERGGPEHASRCIERRLVRVLEALADLHAMTMGS